MLGPMDPTKTALERAFEMAQSGRFPSVSDIKRAIAQEGYSVSQLDGGTLTRQLSANIKEAQSGASRAKTREAD